MTGSAADRVEQLRLLGRLDAAEQEARSALAAEPQDPDLLTSLAVVLLRADRAAEGLAAAEAACAVAPDRERAHRVRGLLASKLGRHEDALAAASTAVTLAPDEPYAALDHARVLSAADRGREALTEAVRAVHLNPELPDAHLLVAGISSDLGDRATAMAAYREVLRLDPENAVARNDLAVDELRQRKLGPALRGFVDAAALDPTLPTILKNLRAVLWNLRSQLQRVVVLGGIPILHSMSSRTLLGSAWTIRAMAVAVLAVGAFLVWRTTRGLADGAATPLRAAFHKDRRLTFAGLSLTGSVLFYVAVVITGNGWMVVSAWVIELVSRLILLVSRHPVWGRRRAPREQRRAADG